MVQRDGSEDFYVAEKTGRVMLLRNGAKQENPILDLTAVVSTDGERGLLGLAFKPNSKLFYVDYTDKAGATHIVEYGLGQDGTADVGTQRELLKIDQPYPNHNGGQLAFGPDGNLYVGMGDGGGSGDPQNNAQNLTVLLGKILRINPTASTDLPYTIPYDNPFRETTGARPEIWAYGLRNPWRFSFDSSSGGLWIADVGQGKYEEIDYVAADPKGGQNYGWPLREGLHQYQGATPTNATEPVYEYDHSDGACSVTGGFVYRGKLIPDLAGRYMFGDYCNGHLSTLTLRGTAWEANRLNIDVANLASFAQDHNGELYTLSQDGAISKIEGA